MKTQIYLMFFHDNHKEGKEHFFSIEYSPKVLPRIGEKVYYYYIEKRAGYKNLNLKNPYGIVTEVLHRYVESEITVNDKDHMNITEITIVKVQLT